MLTTDTTFIPTGFGPPETERQLGSGGLVTPLTRTIVYTYDNLYRLTEADYTSGENYQYAYDEVGNRLQQIIDGDTTNYLYDAANRLAEVDGQAYSFDNNGNLLNSDTLTNTFDAANRLTASTRDGNTVQPIYNGVNDRVGQVTAGVTTTFALDIAGGLPEVIYTSEGNAYLHLPGVIMAESSTGELRYLLSDGLGSVRQAADENGEVVAYNEFDPYGNPVPAGNSGGEPYGFTGEWWENDLRLLHLRARWYAPETGTFLSVDPVESEPPYQYVRGNPVNLTDPSGQCAQFGDDGCWAVYDQIIALCPECAEIERDLPDGRRIKLHQENIQYLRVVLENVKNDWRPRAYTPPTSSLNVTFCELLNPCQDKLIPFLPDGTISVGPGLLGGGIIAFRAGGEVAFDNRGNIAILGGGGAGGTGIAGFNLGLTSVKVTNAPTVDKLSGLSVQLGGDAGEGATMGGEWVWFQDEIGGKYQGLLISPPGLTYGGHAPVPFEIHFTVEYDWMLLGPYDYRTPLYSWLKCKK